MSVGERQARGHPRACGARTRPSVSGLTLVELLVALMLTLAVVGVVGSALPPVFDQVRAVPEAVDLHQRARGAADMVRAAIMSAGAGAALIADGGLVRRVPAVLPRRLLSDPPGAAWADRLSVLSVPALAPQAPLDAPLGIGDTVVRLAWHPSCGVDGSCGFRRGDLAIVTGADGAMALAEVVAVAGRSLTLGTAVDQAVGLPADVAQVRTTTLMADAARRQVRRIDDLAPSQPAVEEVVSMRVRYYGSPAPPRHPVVPGVDTCAVAANGAPRLGLLGPVPGPPVELTVAQFLDGPWCGQGAWQFDADLLRVRSVRVTLRLQAGSPSTRGRDPLRFAVPGTSVRRTQEVRDVEVEVFVPVPNLAWGF